MKKRLSHRLVAMLLALVVTARPGAGQGASPPTATLVRAWRQANEPAILRELAALLAIPNLARDSVNIRRNADAVVAMLERRGIRARLLDGVGGPPAVYGELMSPGATLTIVLYAHYDGQPVDRAQWASDPWTPVLRDTASLDRSHDIPWPTDGARARDEWRVYARSASDDKSPIVAMLTALDALRAIGRAPRVNLKFFFEGEEEAGSEHVASVLRRNAGLLTADAWTFWDGPAHQSGRTQIVFGARGVMGAELTIPGPARALHSGHYGNWAPNPASMMARVLASMRDDDGRITIAGFASEVRPPSVAERRAVAAIPAVDSSLERELLLSRTEGRGARLAETLMAPALNIRGISAGNVGSLASNAIPVVARASLDFRLVPNQTPAHVRSMVERHLRALGYFVTSDSLTPALRLAHAKLIRVQWDSGYAGVRTPVDLPISREMIATVARAIGSPPVVVPMLGGSLPLAAFRDVLGAPLIVIPTVNYDNNQHAANENLRVGNLWRAIEIAAEVMAGPPPATP